MELNQDKIQIKFFVPFKEDLELGITTNTVNRHEVLTIKTWSRYRITNSRQRDILKLVLNSTSGKVDFK